MEDDQIEESPRANTYTAQAEAIPAYRIRNPPASQTDYELILDNLATDEGDLVPLALFAVTEPVNFEDALKEKVWREAMVDELKAIERNQTWELIVVKWVFKVKHNPEGTIAKDKTWLVAKGFLQRAGVDYSEVFAPIARLEIVRLVVNT